MSFGGFLGIGCQEYSIPWEKLKYDTQLGGFRTDITPEELTRAPMVSGDEKDWRDRGREQDLHDHWKVPPYWGLVSSKPSRPRAANFTHACFRDHRLAAGTAIRLRR
ncbi:hypothetical protein BB934_39850 (plasmid) [Microvirga ossetica]|uniref:Uncharacterized protein n=1 Tax=Microvirga ossetica TaxID=1882682 RepID=A0A1B2EWM7_9HYPH|nr:hypothetical protein BB934_39850 [Microvirga ossetica]